MHKIIEINPCQTKLTDIASDVATDLEKTSQVENYISLRESVFINSISMTTGYTRKPLQTKCLTHKHDCRSVSRIFN